VVLLFLNIVSWQHSTCYSVWCSTVQDFHLFRLVFQSNSNQTYPTLPYIQIRSPLLLNSLLISLFKLLRCFNSFKYWK